MQHERVDQPVRLARPAPLGLRRRPARSGRPRRCRSPRRARRPSARARRRRSPRTRRSRGWPSAPSAGSPWRNWRSTCGGLLPGKISGARSWTVTTVGTPIRRGRIVSGAQSTSGRWRSAHSGTARSRHSSRPRSRSGTARAPGTGDSQRRRFTSRSTRSPRRHQLGRDAVEVLGDAAPGRLEHVGVDRHVQAVAHAASRRTRRAQLPEPDASRARSRARRRAGRPRPPRRPSAPRPPSGPTPPARWRVAAADDPAQVVAGRRHVPIAEHTIHIDSDITRTSVASVSQAAAMNP